ncbi:hypothetical protein KIPB_014072, partial [Kipferlia bialata]
VFSFSSASSAGTFLRVMRYKSVGGAILEIVPYIERDPQAGSAKAKEFKDAQGVFFRSLPVTLTARDLVDAVYSLK